MNRVLAWFAFLLLIALGGLAYLGWQPNAAPAPIAPLARWLSELLDPALAGRSSSTRPVERLAARDRAPDVAAGPALVPAGTAANIDPGQAPSFDAGGRSRVALVEVDSMGRVTIEGERDIPPDPTAAGVLDPNAVVSEPAGGATLAAAAPAGDDERSVADGQVPSTAAFEARAAPGRDDRDGRFPVVAASSVSGETSETVSDPSAPNSANDAVDDGAASGPGTVAAVMQRATTERQQAAERAVEAARQALANASVAAGAATPALADTNLPAASGQLSATGIESSGADSSQSVIARSTVTTPSTDFVQSSSDVPTRAAPAASLASAGAPNVADPTASAAAPTTGLAGSGPTAVGSTAEVPPVARAGETLTTGSLAALIDSMRRAERADRDRVAQARAETNRLIAQATSASDEHRRRVLGMIETPERVTSPEADGAPAIPPATSMVSDDARDDVPIPASDRSRPPASSDQVAPDLPQPVGRADQSVDTDPKGNRGPASVADLGTVGEPSFGSGISAENRERLAMVLAPDATLPAPAASREAREQEATIHDFLAGQVVEFQVGRDRLTKNGQRALDRLAELIQRQKDTHIVVQGHTDSVGDRASNLELSGARALVALDYLVSRGIDASRLSAQGFGETKPIASNRTADGRKRNRRIDFAVLEPR